MNANKNYNVLFLCTGNSARSILGEAILNRSGGDRFTAYSAGSNPTGTVNPHAVKLLSNLGFETAGFSSKSWDEFAGPGAPQIDFVFTVCDSAAAEACPVWPGHPMTAHWGISDPAAVEGSNADKVAAFEDAFEAMQNRIDAFLKLAIDESNKAALRQQLNDIGQMPNLATG